MVSSVKFGLVWFKGQRETYELILIFHYFLVNKASTRSSNKHFLSHSSSLLLIQLKMQSQRDFQLKMVFAKQFQ